MPRRPVGKSTDTEKPDSSTSCSAVICTSCVSTACTCALCRPFLLPPPPRPPVPLAPPSPILRLRLAPPTVSCWPSSSSSSSPFLRFVGFRRTCCGGAADWTAPIFAAARRRRSGKQMAHAWSGHSRWWRISFFESAQRGKRHASPWRQERVWFVTKSLVGLHSGTAHSWLVHFMTCASTSK